jgi:hypothetical protein
VGIWDNDHNADEFLNRTEFDDMMKEFSKTHYNNGCKNLNETTESIWKQFTCWCDDCDCVNSTLATPRVNQKENYSEMICNRIRENLQATCYNETVGVVDTPSNGIGSPSPMLMDSSNSSAGGKNIPAIVVSTLVFFMIAVLGATLHRRRKWKAKQDPISETCSQKKSSPSRCARGGKSHVPGKNDDNDDDGTTSSTSLNREARSQLNTRILAENIDELANAIEPDILEILSIDSNDQTIPDPKSPLGQPRCLDEYDEETGITKNIGFCTTISISKWSPGCGNYVDELIELGATSGPDSIPCVPSLSLSSQEFSVHREARRNIPE